MASLSLDDLQLRHHRGHGGRQAEVQLGIVCDAQGMNNVTFEHEKHEFLGNSGPHPTQRTKPENTYLIVLGKLNF